MSKKVKWEWCLYDDPLGVDHTGYLTSECGLTVSCDKTDVCFVMEFPQVLPYLVSDPRNGGDVTIRIPMKLMKKMVDAELASR